jgi:hypothetical protein
MTRGRLPARGVLAARRGGTRRSKRRPSGLSPTPAPPRAFVNRACRRFPTALTPEKGAEECWQFSRGPSARSAAMAAPQVRPRRRPGRFHSPVTRRGAARRGPPLPAALPLRRKPARGPWPACMQRGACYTRGRGQRRAAAAGAPSAAPNARPCPAPLTRPSRRAPRPAPRPPPPPHPAPPRQPTRLVERGELQPGAARFFDASEFSDVALVAPGGRRLRCHRVVLAVRGRRRKGPGSPACKQRVGLGGI